MILFFLLFFLPLTAFDIDQLAFGQKDSPIDVYIFTDWFCPACQRFEPKLVEMSPDIQKEAAVYYIDALTNVYSPYNISFMLNNKDKYLFLRALLAQHPTTAKIEEVLKEAKIEFTPVPQEQIDTVNNYFRKMSRRYRILRTPTIIVYDKRNNQQKQLVGLNEITKSQVLKAIDQLKKGRS